MASMYIVLKVAKIKLIGSIEEGVSSRRVKMV